MKYLIILIVLLLPRLAYGQKTCTNVSSTSQNCQVTATWTASTSGNPTNYSIRRSDAGGAKTEIGKVAGNITSYQNAFTDAGGVAHCWDVIAINAGGQSAPSNQDCWTTPAISISAPSVPQGFTLSAISRNTLRMSWSDMPNNTGFEVWGRLAKATSFDQLVILPADVTTYDWGARLRYTSYCAQVRAITGGINSGFSEIACATTNN